MVEKDKQVQLKNYNRRSVLNYIRKNKTATKAGLSAASGLTFMAIKKILEELEGLNLIRRDEMEGVGVGRKAVSYAVNEVYRYTIGIHINKFVTSVALMNLRGDILQIKRYPMEEDMGSQYAFMDMLAGGVREVIAQAGIEREKDSGYRGRRTRTAACKGGYCPDTVQYSYAAVSSSERDSGGEDGISGVYAEGYQCDRIRGVLEWKYQGYL